MRTARLVGAALCLLLVVPFAAVAVVLTLAPGTVWVASLLWPWCAALAGGAWHLWLRGPARPRPATNLPGDRAVKAAGQVTLHPDEERKFLVIVAGYRRDPIETAAEFDRWPW